ncbi:MAG: hypothetical protein PWP23_2278 [Candidatus Sumerlaeota bacterium]|nr:hypothetical protein [Candidatus Sumerlaeota bacterium]
MSDTRMLFESLPDSATLRVVPVEGGLAPEREEAVLAVLGELLAQWRANGVIRQGAVTLHPSRAFLLLAWQPTGPDISGCTKDGLTKTLEAFEAQLGTRLLNAPRMAVEQEGAVLFLTQKEFKERRRSGRITGSTRVFDHLLNTVGALRAGGFETTVDASWYGRIPA